MTKKRLKKKLRTVKVVRDVSIMNPVIKYKERDKTEYLCVVFHPINVSPQDIYREQRIQCMFSMGVHFLLYPDGSVYECLPMTAPADILYDHADDGIYIMAVGCDSVPTMADAQRHVFDKMQGELNLEHFITGR